MKNSSFATVPPLAFLITGLVLPQLAQGQALKRRADFYVLTDTPNVRHLATLKILSNNEVAIRELNGRKHTLHAPSVALFQSKGHRYYSLGNFEIKPGNPKSRVELAFVELLDSGRVSLYTYKYDKVALSPMLVSSTILPRAGSTEATLYLLRTALAPQATAIPSDGLFEGGTEFCLALQPYLANRPDLLALLLAKKFHIEDLPDIVRALNTDKPFARTNRAPFGVD